MVIPAVFLPMLLSLVTEPARAAVCDGKGDGMYVDPSDSNKYYQCVGGTEYDFNCGAGLVFYESTHVCGWPDGQVATVAPLVNGQTTHAAVVVQTDSPPLPTGAQCKRRVCYYTNWSQYRPSPATYTPANIDPSMCTHIIYAFAKMEGNKLVPFEDNDIGTGYPQVTALKSQSPGLKVSIAVGGWNMGTDPFHQMVSSDASMSEFVTTTVQFLKDHNFDGLDLDWEYPGNRGSPAEDRHKFSVLIQKLRQTFDKEGLILSAAVAAGKWTVDTAYEIPDIAQNLDFINLMTYDLHGSWEYFTGHNSPLYASSSEQGSNAYLNVDWAANYWAQQGCPKEKLVVGLPLYGRSFTLSGSDSKLGASASVGTSGPYTKEAGYLAYYEICEVIKSKNLQRQFLSDQHVPYVVDGNQWIGYDDESSLREKARYVRDNGFGGVMYWAIDLDDFSGDFCGNGKNPLLSAVKDECSK